MAIRDRRDDEGHARAGGRELCDQPARSDLDIIGMRTERDSRADVLELHDDGRQLRPARSYRMIGPEQSSISVGSNLIDHLKMKPLSTDHRSVTRSVQAPLSGDPNSPSHGVTDL